MITADDYDPDRIAKLAKEILDLCNGSELKKADRVSAILEALSSCFEQMAADPIHNIVHIMLAAHLVMEDLENSIKAGLERRPAQ